MTDIFGPRDESAVARYCESVAGCLQCFAESALTIERGTFEAALRESVAADPVKSLLLMIDRMAGAREAAGLVPSADESRTAWRKMRLAARTILLEPHECGKARGGEDG